MYIALNNINDNNGARYKAKRVGRGLGSGKGKTAGKGYKGQKSRSGVAINGFEGGQMPIHRRLPKRGFVNVFKKNIQILNLAKLSQFIDDNKIDISKTITKDLLNELSLIKDLNLPLKLLADKDFKYRISIEADLYSSNAKQIIESFNGNVVTKA